MRVVVVVASALVLATPAAAQDGGLPTELWSEYPLVQTVERTSQPGVGPFLPPTDAGAAPGSDDAPPWGLWALAAAAGAAALLVATRLARPAPASRGGDRAAPVQLRPQARPRQAATSLPLAQYAPPPSLVLVDAPEEPRRSVVRRTGLLRSRYVVLEGRSPSESDEVAVSKSFWNLGGASVRERLAEDAWDDLMNDLRVSGWEPDPTRRSDFYVLLQPVEEDAPSIVPTIEAYGRADEPED
jgi:hypothetical protein